MKVGFNTSGQEVGFLKPQLPLNQGEGVILQAAPHIDNPIFFDGTLKEFPLCLLLDLLLNTYNTRSHNTWQCGGTSYWPN